MKTTASPLLIPFAEGTDGADAPALTEAMANKLHALIIAINPGWITGGVSGNLIVVQGTGAGAFKTMSGDVTIASTGATTIGALKVLTAKLAELAVTTAKLDNDAVTEAKIANTAVSAAKILNAAVETAKIKDAAVTQVKLAAAQIIDTQRLVDLTVTSAKIAEATIIAAKIAANAIEAKHIIASAIETAKIKDAAVTQVKLENAAIIDTARLVNLAVTAAKIAEATITAAKLANNAVTAEKIIANAIETAKIKDLAVTEPKVADGAVTSRKYKPTTGQVNSTSSLVLTASKVLIPGLKFEITPPVASIMWLKVAFNKIGAGGGSIAYFLDTVEKEPFSFQTDEGSSYVEFRVPLTAALHTIEIKASNAGVAATIQHNGTLTRIMYELVAS